MNKFEPDGVSCISNWGGIEISLNIDDSEIIELIHSKICPNQVLRV